MFGPVPADVIGQPTAGAAQPGGAVTEAGTAAAAGQQQDAETVAITADQQTNSRQNEFENAVDQAQAATNQSPANLQEGDAAAQRFEIGKSLTRAQRKQVLESLVDVYKSKGAEREFKGQDANGNDRYGYVHSPELFEKSDITGAMVRYYVTLPGGRIAHPTEIFPDYSETEIEAELSRQQADEQRISDSVARHTAQSVQFDNRSDANKHWNLKSFESIKQCGSRKVLPATERTALSNGKKIVLVPNDSYAKNAKAYEAAGWRKEGIAAAQDKGQQDEDVRPEARKIEKEEVAARKAKQPITRADVEAAQQQAAASIGARIDAMSAGDMNKIAKKFLPTMGMKPTMSKANNKAAMTDAKINLMAAAAEVGAVLPAEVTRALQADMEGRVVDVAQDDGITKPAAQSKQAQEATKPEASAATDFIPAPDGGLDYGEITPEMGRAMRRQAGKIRLRQGNEAWGLTHIRNRHLDQFQRLGFDSAEAFVASVAANFTAIYQRPGSALDVVFAESGTGQRLAVQLEPSVDGDFYDVKTASPVRADQFKNKKPLWERAGTSTPTAMESSPPSPRSQSGSASVPLAAVDAKAAKPAAIEDFGEKLEGASKDLPPSLKEDVSDEQMVSLPLSKIWPANAHEEIQNDAAAALAFAARQEIPAKPRQSVKVQRWVQKVKDFRALVTSDDALAGNLDKLGLDGLSQRVVAGSVLEGFFAKVRLLAQLPRDTWGRVDKVREYPDAVRYGEDGQKTPIPFSAVAIDGEVHQFDGAKSIGPDELSKIKELLGAAAPKKGGLTAADFEIRTYKNRAESFINRKGDKEMRPLKTFTGQESGKQAREWLKANVAQAEAQWEAVKARDNVGKSDVRTAQNRQRVGADHRKGADVTAQMFEDAFGFRGVQFGNWVAQGAEAKDRQGLLNEAYDALMDLSLLLGVPSRAMSLDGSLGLSLGARGSGKAAAHFEHDSLVINLTKTKGAGSLAHEWFHALDNYFRRQRGGMDKQAGREDAYITYKPEAAWVPKAGTRRAAAPLTSGQLRQWLQARGMYDSGKSLEENAQAANFERDPQHKDGVRPQVEAAFAQLVQALNDSPMAARATVLDGGAAKGYWGRIIERGARSFENYVINKMALQGYSNDFLANIRSFDEWQALGKNAERYPYLTPAEEGPVVEAFDNLFGTIETRQGDDGNVAMFSRMNNNAATQGVSNEQRQTPNGIPAGLPATSDPDSQYLERRINNWLQTSGWRADRVSAVSLPIELRTALDRFTDTTGTRVVLFRNLTPEIEDFNGVNFRDGRVFINETSQHPATLTAAHEWVHNLKRTNPELYQLLEDEVRDQGRIPEWHQRNTQEEGQDRGIDHAVEELTAAAVSDAMTDPAFLEQLAQRNQSVFRRVARAFLDFLDTLTAGWRDQGSNAYLRDVQAFRDKLADVLDRLPATGQGTANFAANPARLPGSTQDKAVMRAIADGKNARDVLRLIANGSKDPFLRQVARLLLKAGITPNIQFGHIGKTAKGDPIHGQYRGKSDTIAIAGSAEYAAERIFMHEAMHAATMRALKKGGLVRVQLQKLMAHVQKQKGAAGFYGMQNVDEFVAEVFTNPDFQKALRGMSAPAGNSLKSAWDSFVRILRGILGLSNDSNNALSQALELGVAAVRQDMVLRKRGARMPVDADTRKARILQGDPVAVLSLEDAPAGGYADIARWAAALFAQQGGKAVSPDIWEVTLNEQSARDSMAHGGANAAKKIAFAAVKDVIERGALVYQAKHGRVDSFYVSAPVRISGRDNIVTALVRRDQNTKRMYLHSVALKENLLKPSVSAVDAKASELSSATTSGDSATLAKAKGQGKAASSDVARELNRLLTLDTSGSGVANFGVDDFTRNVGEGIKGITATNIKKAGKHKLTDWLKLGLQFLGRRQLVDVYGDLIPQMRDYDRLAAQMEADKNESGAEADELVRRWAKLPDEGKLADLMHEATLAQVDADADVAYVDGDDKAQSAILKNRFKALSPEAQAVYREARDGYKAHHEKVRQAIRERIERSELSSEKRHELLTRMDDDFFQKVKGVYFPLARFGRYVAVVKDGAGQVVSVSRAETMPEAESARAALLKAFPTAQGFTVGRVTLDKEFVASHKMVGRGFMTDLYRALEGVDLPAQQLAELEDTLGQLYLSSLPDLSWAKHGIHRKGTPGFSQDARRAFAQNMFHGARYLAKLRYSDVIVTFNGKQAASAPAPANTGVRFSRSGSTDTEVQRQFNETERADGGKAAYDRAKAAGKTKLTHGQWVQVRTPNFKAWFGDWEAVRAQERLDAMEPVQVRVPDAWRGLGHVELRQKMAEELDRMVREKTQIEHPELGMIQVGRAGAKKTSGSARDPAKSLVAADIEALIPASIYARTEPSRGGDGPDIEGYSTLLARVDVDGVPLVASFTVRHQSDGQWYYNAVALHDGKEKAQDSYGRPDQQAGSRFAPIAGLSDFIRRPLARVNPEAVSKVVDSATGEPLVVYHGTEADFSEFSREYIGSANTQTPMGSGFFFAKDPAVAGRYAERASANVMPVYVSVQNPAPTLEAMTATGSEYDGFINSKIVVARSSLQVKSATGNNGNFDPANPDIRFSRSAAPSLSEVAETGRDTAWTGPAASKWDDFIYKMQDKHIDTKRALEAVSATQQKILI